MKQFHTSAADFENERRCAYLKYCCATCGFRDWAQDLPVETREVQARLPGLRKTLVGALGVCDVFVNVL